MMIAAEAEAGAGAGGDRGVCVLLVRLRQKRPDHIMCIGKGNGVAILIRLYEHSISSAFVFMIRATISLLMCIEPTVSFTLKDRSNTYP